jgi:hypothetical protein
MEQISLIKKQSTWDSGFAHGEFGMAGGVKTLTSDYDVWAMWIIFTMNKIRKRDVGGGVGGVLHRNRGNPEIAHLLSPH